MKPGNARLKKNSNPAKDSEQNEGEMEQENGVSQDFREHSENGLKDSDIRSLKLVDQAMLYRNATLRGRVLQRPSFVMERRVKEIVF